ncbi:MAG: response regulator [Planctomycetota bacterium]
MPLVLLADDEPHISAVLERALLRAGFEVETAEDGEEALEVAIERKPSVIITDYQMPVLDGVGFVSRLRATPGLEHTPVVMLTARGHTIADAALEDLNLHRLLEKPFSAADLVRCAQEIVETQEAA